LCTDEDIKNGSGLEEIKGFDGLLIFSRRKKERKSAAAAYF
jgi:hypothetical protein